ncbi:glutaredoxin family protein [Rhodoplanes sp. TEM]|uniref:Glutaredoxin family protein n=1 Tax=Rhodoplanes tepidamans TaxID=200616 RepID=A0ABT5JIA2_RHOTP|nr:MULTISPECIES: glutaredoxin family protein [Rhodoplanes]MDC7789415.1 glutaredoxin family protein [Rhodoplanes tepidamans]MDC7986457.1 glutaredoxin family protein [Rhodoplanes sp. TEM]MDQ0358949.1 glutaredoxin [Rhodoplanes tepidamans]
MPRLPTLTPFRFRLALAVLLGLVFVALELSGAGPARPPAGATVATTAGATAETVAADGRLHVFVHPECPHCHAALRFLRSQPGLDPVLHDVSVPAEETLLLATARRLGIAEADLGVPLFVVGSRHMIGFDTAETTGRDLLALAAGAGGAGAAADPVLRLPLLGPVDPARWSLAGLAIVTGLSDGFNPCAMWVLIYLISLIAGLRDRRKIWWLVGTFVLASGVLYFLFMTAWLNTFLLIGYVRPLTRLVGLAAIGFGADHLFGLVATRGAVVCETGDAGQRRRTMQWARDAVAAPIGIGSIALVIGLAVTVNAVEFVCSAALPAIFTHILSLADLTALAHYGYIALYVLFFMLDDLVIFGLAAMAAERVLDTRWAAVSRGVGGVVLIGLGVWMLAR